MTAPPPADPAAPATATRHADPRRRVTTMTWVVLGLVPVLWIVELTGPEWLNLGLRALWVVAALGTVGGGLAVWLGSRRRSRADGVGDRAPRG